MTEFAKLIARFETKGFVEGEKALDRLATAADAAETQVNQAGDAAQRMGDKVGGVAPKADRAGRSTGAAADQAQRYGREANRAAGYTGNLTANFNDIAVMLAAGQSPLMLAMQQGTQITQVFEQMGGGVNALRGIGSAFMAMISPMNLATLGIIAVGAAAAQWFLGSADAARTFQDRIDALSGAVKRANEAADAFTADGLEDLRAKFGEITPAIEAMVEAQRKLALADNVAAARDALVGLENELGDRWLQSAIGEVMELFEVTRLQAGGLQNLIGNFKRLSLDQQIEGAARLRAELERATDGFTDMTDPQREMLRMILDLEAGLNATRNSSKGVEAALAGGALNLAAMRDAATGLAGSAGTIAESLGAGAMAGLFDVYATMLRMAQERSAAEQAILGAQQQQNAIAAATLAYGRESAQVIDLQRQAMLATLDAQLDSLGVYGAQRDAITAAALRGFDLQRALAAAGGAAGGVAGRAAAIRAALAPAVDAAWALARALAAAAGGFGGAAGRLASLAGQALGLSRAGEAMSSALGGLATPALNLLRGAAERVQGTLGQMRAMAEGAADSIGGGGGGGGGGLTTVVEDLIPEVKSLAEVFEEQATRGIDSFAGAFGDFISGGLRDFKGFAKSIIDSFKGMISQLIATAVGNPIKIALGLATAPSAAVADAAAPGGGGLLSSISGAAGGFLGGVGSGLQAALGMGGFTSAGIFNVAANAATAAATGVSALSATIGAAIPVVAGIAAVFSFFRTKTKTLDSGIRVAIDGVEALTETFEVIEKKRFWGLSRRIRETFGAADRELVDAVQDTYTSLRESVLDMGSVLGIGARALNGFVDEIKLSTEGMSAEEAQAAVLAEFEKLGVRMAEQIMGVRTETVVDTRAVADAEARLAQARQQVVYTSNGFVDSMSRQRIAQAEAALAAARAGTSVTHLNGAFSNLKQPGENALELLTRLSSGFLAANQAMRALGHGLFETSAAGIRASARLVEAMGGLEQFQRGVDFFFRNFYSAQEQAVFAAQSLREGFRDLGVNGGRLPQTMDAFRAIVDRLMDAGRVAAAGELINLAPAFVEMLRLRQEIQGVGEDAEAAADRLERNRRRADEREDLERRLLELQGNTAELRRRELAALFPANRALQRMIWGLEDAQAAMEALDEEDFASLFDFERAQGRAAVATSQPRVYQPQPVAAQTVTVTQDAGVRQELADLRGTMTQVMAAVSLTMRQTAQVLRKWDVDGLPLERT